MLHVHPLTSSSCKNPAKQARRRGPSYKSGTEAPSVPTVMALSRAKAPRSAAGRDREPGTERGEPGTGPGGDTRGVSRPRRLRREKAPLQEHGRGFCVPEPEPGAAAGELPQDPAALRRPSRGPALRRRRRVHALAGSRAPGRVSGPPPPRGTRSPSRGRPPSPAAPLPSEAAPRPASASSPPAPPSAPLAGLRGTRNHRATAPSAGRTRPPASAGLTSAELCGRGAQARGAPGRRILRGEPQARGGGGAGLAAAPRAPRGQWR